MELERLTKLIETKRELVDASRSMLIGISGIDASGKGFVSQKLAQILESNGQHVALINADGWLNLPHIRFNAADPAKHFYEKALRLEEMFENLVLPLKKNRSVRLVADFAEETSSTFRKHEYSYNDVDIILLEGVFIFKKAFVEYFDLKIWIECSFETALKRAIERAQEGLSTAETIEAYDNVYFPAQRIHFGKDGPQNLADLIIENQ